jgi:signal transduction histidine kinase
MTPYTTLQPMPGVEIHAHAYETMATGQFLTDAAPSLVLLLAVALVAGAALIFRRFTGLPAYSLAAALLGLAHLLPHIFFMAGIIFSHVAPMLAAWFAVVVAAAWQYFSTRLALATAEDERARYQQAIQFVTHEMRTPLTAIQGSSELMGRYKLTEEKQKQLAAQINSESKRLARMIQTFLDVERLGAGQMQLKQDPIPVPALLTVCLDRVKPLAERKNIALNLHPTAEVTLQGDRELLEYAVYNLLTNAIKYSPPDTRVELSAAAAPGRLAIAVRDQGMGMSQAELKKLFTRFYRTARAEQSGEVGTGIGLSIVQQIVQLHGGRIDVTSTPGAGSCFTLSLPAR